jgi:tetratricopeptide (TPR) repeat protein/DNA-binding MarR family transcriptional regulator
MSTTASSRPGVQERIFLHLSDYIDYSDKVEVPFALSQMGIANAVSIARSNVPRAISGMKEDGHLIERQAHVTGVSRKRKAYFLTDEGAKFADEIWTRISEISVRIIHSDGRSDKTTLAEAIEESELTLRHVDMLRYMDDSGTIDLSGLTSELIDRDLSKHIEKQLVSYLNDLPRTRRFYGREKELDVMAKLLEAKSASILVPGIAGIGKTALSTKILDRFTHRRNLLYHRCQDWEGSRAFLEACAEWLSAVGNNDLSDYLDSSPVPQTNMTVNLIAAGLSEAPSLIVIDDLHKVGDETLYSILKGLTLRIHALEEVGLVMFSRSFKMVVPESDQSGNIVTLVMPLQGLDAESSKQILTAMPEMNSEQFTHIYSLSRGHPLILELINRGNVAETFHATLEAFVEKEIFSRLSGSEKRLLGAIAVFREPIPVQAIHQVETSVDLLDDLVEKGLARQSDAENFDVHDLVREFLLRSMDEEMKNGLHSAAVNWYRGKKGDAANRIEFIHHLSHTGDEDSLAEVLLTEGHGLVSSGHTELLSILNSLESSDFDSKIRGLIRELKGDILTIQGRWDEAEEEYDAATKHIDGSQPSNELARLLSARADIAVKRGAMEDALELHRNALKIQIGIRDAVGAARTYNNMGHIFRRRRDIRRALEVYGNVEDLLKKEKDPELNDARIRLASAFIEMEELDRARDHALFAYENTKGPNQEFLHARSRAVLGRYYAKISDNDLALIHYSGALDTLSNQNNPQSTVEVEMLLGQVLIDAGRREEAAEHYLNGLAVAESNDFRMLQGELLARLGEVETDSSQRMNYLQRSLSLFRDLGAVGRMKEVQNSVHRAVMGR